MQEYRFAVYTSEDDMLELQSLVRNSQDLNPELRARISRALSLAFGDMEPA